MKTGLYVGTIAHRRYIPKSHSFRYPFYMWFLDLEMLDQLPPLGWWFSAKKFALSRLRRSDYLGDPSQSLADSVKQKMQELTGRSVAGKVFGLMNVRTLGLYFSPVNFYYGYDKEGNLSHFLAEVSNIPWNERHQYGHYVAGDRFSPTNPKQFHVSPFNSLDQEYRWQIQPPAEIAGINLQVHDRRGQIFEACLQLKHYPLTLDSVRKQLSKKPIMTLFIVAGIYYQALKLFLKGVPYVPYKKEMI